MLVDEEKVLFSCGSTSCFLEDSIEPRGKGRAFVTTSRLLWVDGKDGESGVAVAVDKIQMHAISRDASAFHVPCLYCQIDMDDDEVFELRLAPEDADDLVRLFEALSESAALNPSENEFAQDEDGDSVEGDFFHDVAEASESIARVMLDAAADDGDDAAAAGAAGANGSGAGHEEAEEEEEDGEDMIASAAAAAGAQGAAIEDEEQDDEEDEASAGLGQD